MDNPYKSYETSIVDDFCHGLCGGVTQHDSREFSVFLGGLSQDEACEAGPRSNQAEFSKSKIENWCFLMLKTEKNVVFDIYFLASPNLSSWN